MPLSLLRKWWFWALIALFVAVASFTLFRSGGAHQRVSMTQFIESVRAGEVARV